MTPFTPPVPKNTKIPKRNLSVSNLLGYGHTCDQPPLGLAVVHVFEKVVNFQHAEKSVTSVALETASRLVRKRPQRRFLQPEPDEENPTVSKGAKHKKEMEQSQSMYMSSLPIEVRTMIYQEVLCGPVGVVHITTRKDGKLGYFRCKVENGRCRGLECFHSPEEDLYSTSRTRDKDLYSTRSPSNAPDMAGGGMLALLQSCRQVLVFSNIRNIIYLSIDYYPATPKP